MTLILSNDDVEQTLSMPACIEALETAYKDLSDGVGVSRRRSDCITRTEFGEDAIYGLKSMDGVVPSLGVGAVRINSDIVTNPIVGNGRRRVKNPAAPGGRYVGLVLLFSTATGEPLAIFPDGVLQHIRVGAANGLGVKYMARKDVATVGILGSGWQAETQLAAVCAVREIEKIFCFSPNKDNREAFSAKMSEALGVPVLAVGQPEEATQDVDVVMCGTNSITPIYFKASIRPGMHLSSIKKPEIDPEAIRACDLVAVHTHDTSPILVVSKGVDFHEETKDVGWNSAVALNFDAYPTLPDLIAGKAQGRRREEDVTCFINNLGLGYQFAAAGSVVYRVARERGLGHEIPTDWLTETVHP